MLLISTFGVYIKMPFRFAAGTVLLRRASLVWQRLHRVDVGLLQPLWRQQNLCELLYTWK